MSSFVFSETQDPIAMVVGEILRDLDTEQAQRLRLAQPQARKACRLLISTMEITSPEERRRVLSYVHMAKVEVLLREFAFPGTKSATELAKSVYEQFCLLVKESPLNHRLALFTRH